MSKDDNVEIIEGGAHIEPRALNDDDIEQLATLADRVLEASSTNAPLEEYSRRKQAIGDFIRETPLPYEGICYAAYKNLPGEVAEPLAQVVRAICFSIEIDYFGSGSVVSISQESQERALGRFVAAVRKSATEPPDNLTEALEDIWRVVVEHGRRLTANAIFQKLEEKSLSQSMPTLKQNLAILSQRLKVLPNRRDTKPPGYGLPHWD